MYMCGVGHKSTRDFVWFGGSTEMGASSLRSMAWEENFFLRVEGFEPPTLPQKSVLITSRQDPDEGLRRKSFGCP